VKTVPCQEREFLAVAAEGIALDIGSMAEDLASFAASDRDRERKGAGKKRGRD